MKERVSIYFIFLLIITLFSKCSNFNYIKLTPEIKFSIPYSSSYTKNKIRVIKNSDYFYQIPDKYIIKDNILYLVDKFNFRILLINKNNKIIKRINFSTNKIEFPFIYTDTNYYNLSYILKKDREKLFEFLWGGNLKLDKNNNIYIENILTDKDEEHKVNNYSIILKFNFTGTPEKIISLKENKDKIFPFVNLENFDFDKKNRLFVFLKYDENWRVLRYNITNNNAFEFNLNNFLTNISKGKDEKVIIENIDFTANGKSLIISINKFKNNNQYEKTIFYILNEDGHFKKLFNNKFMEYNFLGVSYNDLIYLGTTLETKNEKERIIFKILNMSGKTVINKLIELNRKNAKWFNISLQKDNLISGINLKANKFNVVVWK